MTSSSMDGGCQCGAIRYRILPPISHTNLCHCRMCQRANGAPVVAWVTLLASRLQATKGQAKFYRSSARAERGFCADCGTPLYWRRTDAAMTADTAMIDVAAATLDDPTGLRPREHIWIESAMPWLKLADNLPRYPAERTG